MGSKSTSIVTEARRTWVRSVLHPPIVSLVRMSYMSKATGTANCVRDQVSPCSLCHSVEGLRQLDKRCNVHITVQTIMRQVGLDLEEEGCTFCPSCWVQLQNLVSLKRKMDRLGDRLATMIIGLHTLLSTTKMPEEETEGIGVNEMEQSEDTVVLSPGVEESMTSGEENPVVNINIPEVTAKQEDIEHNSNHSVPPEPETVREGDGVRGNRYKLLAKLRKHIQTRRPSSEGPKTFNDVEDEELFEGENQERTLKGSESPGSVHKDRTISMPHQSLGENLHATKQSASASVQRQRDRVACPTCKRTFSTQKLLKRHMSYVHTSGGKPILCHICARVFRYTAELGDHLLTHLPESQRPYPCSHCSRRFADRHNLQRHSRTHNPDPNPAAEPRALSTMNVKRKPTTFLYGKRSNTGSSITRHIGLHTRNNSQRFRQRKGLKARLSILSRVSPRRFLCPACGKTFATRATLRQHTTSLHTTEKPFICQVCNRAFSRLNVLRTHRRVHTGEKPYACHICSKRFGQLPHLNAHLKSKAHLPENQRPFPCDHCDHRFVDKRRLAKHIETHADEEPFVCSICTRTFKAKGHLKLHLRHHMNEDDMPYSCTVCPRRFAFKCSLRKHSKTHASGETERKIALAVSRPHQCDLCGKGCISRAGFRKHMRFVHEGAGPIRVSSFPESEVLKAVTHPDVSNPSKVIYTCQTCGSVFSWKQAFKKHMRGVHWKEEVCKCGVCGKLYQSIMGLWYHSKSCPQRPKIPIKCYFCTATLDSTRQHDRHLRKHTLERPFYCTPCGQGHLTWSTMKRHMVPSLQKRKGRTVIGGKSCYFCNKVPSFGNLVNHMRTHTLERPYICNKCGKDFARCSNLTDHSYRCESEGKTLRRSGRIKGKVK